MKATTSTLVVTGSSGFVGEKLALVAIREGYEVIGIDFKKSKKLSCLQLELDLSSENFFDEIPPSTSTISPVSLKGAYSNFIPFPGAFERRKPKSMCIK
jgi:hypothetical protein